MEPTIGKVAVERDLPPPPKEGQLKRLMRQWRSRGRHWGLRYWFITTGFPILVVYISLVLANGVAIGWANSYEVMIGITSPAKTTMPTLAWGLSVAGWLLAPGLAGAVAGYVVSNAINSRRSRTINEQSDSGTGLTILIPRLSDLCFTQNPFGVNGNFAVGFVKLHREDWRQAQDHWEILVEKVLETDVVEKSAAGSKAMQQAVTATVTLLETTELRSRCPLCRTDQAAIESEVDQDG